MNKQTKPTFFKTSTTVAPVGYVLLSEKGLILEANLTAAGLLEVPHSEPVQHSFSRLVCKKDIDELLRFQHLTVGREVRMIELKKEINTLLNQAGKPEKYRMDDVQ